MSAVAFKIPRPPRRRFCVVLEPLQVERQVEHGIGVMGIGRESAPFAINRLA